MVKDNNSTRALANSALATALAVIIAIIGLFVPLLSFASLLWPVPIIIVIKRYGLKYGIYSTVASGLIVGLISQPLYAIYVIFGFGALGLTIGYGVEKEYPAGRTLIIASVASLLSKLLLIYASTKIMGINPIELQIEAMAKSFELTMDIYKGVGLDSIEDMRKAFVGSLELIKVTLPAVLIFASVMDSFFNYTVARVILKRFKLYMQPLPPFGDWRFPSNISLGFIILVGLTFAGGYFGLQNTEVIMNNIFLLFNLVFFIQGLSVLYHFLTRRGLARIVKILLLTLVTFNQLLTSAAVFTGLLDVLFDFRKLSEAKG